MATTDLGLEQTIARAHSALEARERHLRGIAERKARGTRRNWLKVIVMGMLVFALYEVFDHMSPHAVTVSHSHVEDDLEKVLGQVRHDVELTGGKFGRWCQLVVSVEAPRLAWASTISKVN